jgi:hypothetical protein
MSQRYATTMPQCNPQILEVSQLNRMPDALLHPAAPDHDPRIHEVRRGKASERRNPRRTLVLENSA